MAGATRVSSCCCNLVSAVRTVLAEAVGGQVEIISAKISPPTENPKCLSVLWLCLTECPTALAEMQISLLLCMLRSKLHDLRSS